MVTIILYAKQKKRHRCIEWTFGLQGRRQGWDDLREQHRNKCETDFQSRLDAWDKCSELVHWDDPNLNDFTILKILQFRLQHYMNHEIPDVQAGFRKGKETRDQTANIHWVIEKLREFQTTSTSALLSMPKPLTVWITTNFDCVENSGRDGNTRPPDVPPEISVCRSRSNS